MRAVAVIGLLVGRSAFAKSDVVADPDIKLSALLQAWTVNDTTPWPAGATLNFRIRRTEIALKAAISHFARGFVMVDPAKPIWVNPNGTLNPNGDHRLLQDIGIVFLPWPSLELVLGQVKTPTSAEGLEPTGSLILPERSIVGRTFGDRREPGVIADWKRENVRLRAMISNGQGTNANDTNTSKDLNVRLDLTPTSGFNLGAFTGLADFSYVVRGSWGANLRYEGGPILMKFEAAYLKTSQLTGWGANGEVAYTVGTEWQPVVRYEILKPPQQGVESTSSGETIGLNYYLVKHRAKIQGSATLMHNMSGNLGSTVVSGRGGTLLILAFSMEL